MNVTDVNDKIYDAAKELGVPSAEHAAEMTAALHRGHWPPGIGRPDSEPLATETMPEIVEMIEALIEREHAYESGGDVYFRVRSFDGYGKLSNRDPDEMDQGEEAGTAEPQGEPARLRALEGAQAGRGHRVGEPWGEGRPGWHIECSAMAEKVLGADFEIHGGGVDLVFPHHENEVAQIRGRPRASAGPHLDAQRDDPDRRREDVEVGREHLRPARGDRRYGAQAVVAFLISGHYRQPLEFSDGALEEASARVDRIRNFLREPGVEGEDDFASEREEALVEALCDDFNTPRALAAVFELIAEANRRPLPGARAALERCCRCWGSRGCCPTKRRGRRSTLLRERDEARAAGDFERADTLATAWPSWAGRSATRPRAQSSCAVADVVYGRRPVAEAERGRRGVLRVVTADDASPDELTRLRGPPTTRGSSPRSSLIPTPIPASCLGTRALIVALDQVQDPHNLGAVCRSAEAAGATGVVIPDRRAVAVTPAVCKASAGAVEHLAVARVRNLADWLERGEASGALGLRRGCRSGRAIHVR